MKHLKKLALICGGPSKERGISLNSARSVMDHLKGLPIAIVPLFVDSQKRFYPIASSQLYSNTPADFDFKLQKNPLNEEALKSILKEVDLVFPVVHGEFGEDGELQSLLETGHIPFVGHSSLSCQRMYPKHLSRHYLQSKGLVTKPQLALSRNNSHFKVSIENFFHAHSLKRAIVKPSCGGSSISVYSVSSPQEAYEKMEKIFGETNHQTLLLEPFFEGKEFTIVVLQNSENKPVALIPTEIELSYDKHEIFDYRKKYLPTNLASHHTPPRFTFDQVQNIRRQAETIFALFEMRDFVRIDGWILDDGSICFSDINPISGLEQNSFFFRQTSLIGLSHKSALEYILNTSCLRHHLSMPPQKLISSLNRKQSVFVLFGNSNAERQVSLMSGTNVWLKLLQSEHFDPAPYFLDPQGCVWELPYSFALNHTVEEIYHNCIQAEDHITPWLSLIQDIRRQLNLMEPYHPAASLNKYSLDHFSSLAKNKSAFVFIALHGSSGEDGTLQKYFESQNIFFNGCKEIASNLCMDKLKTGKAISELNEEDILSLPKVFINLQLFSQLSYEQIQTNWEIWTKQLSSSRLIIKPNNDGCSSGIVLLNSSDDLARYCHFFKNKTQWIPPHSFFNQHSPVEMPLNSTGESLLEPYIETDEITYRNQSLHINRKSGWVELTIGVLEEKGHYSAFNPSITVVEGAVLSLEEKFQGGTGINLTPPPLEIMSKQATEKVKKLAIIAAKSLNIENYARLDLFFNTIDEKIIVIEANTLPALTPSTVIYHQALAENPPLEPLHLLEKIIHSRLQKNLI